MSFLRVNIQILFLANFDSVMCSFAQEPRGNYEIQYYSTIS